jgi:hypothetical protein
MAELPGADLNGYMPLRGDFDSEFDNAAEEILAEMEFSPTLVIDTDIFLKHCVCVCVFVCCPPFFLLLPLMSYDFV